MFRKFGDTKRVNDSRFPTSCFTHLTPDRGKITVLFLVSILISYNRGAFACCFSNSGLYLAIACIGIKTHPIKVYDVLTGERVATLEGHQDLVYQLNWSSDDS